MPKNYINVSVSTGKPTRVSVSTPANQQNVDITRDTSAYNAEIAKQWATSENLVLNEDYSAKHYAKEAKKSEQNAESYLESTRETYNTFVSDANDYRSELTELKDAGAVEINEVVASGKDEINSAKTTIINDIEFVADGEKEEIQELADKAKDDIESTGFYMRDGKLYFINSVGEEEEFKTNDNELNNPFSLGDSKYSPVALNNLSWLKSEGQWNSKDVYPAYYDWALTNFNNGVEGFALSTGEYTDYDVVINPADETFRLPLLDGSEDLPSDRYDDLTLNASGSTYTAPANGWYYVSKASTASGQYLVFENLTSNFSTNWQGTGGGCRYICSVRKGDQIQVIYTLAGSTNAFRFIYAQGNGSLYFYVGETVQNANLINAGRIEETLVKKVDMQQATIASFPSNRYIDLTLGANAATYIAPANGWFAFAKMSSAASQVFQIRNNSAGFITNTVSHGNAQYVDLYLPFQKGQICQIDYTGTGTLAYFRFIYAEGEI